VLGELARFKAPREIVFVDALPKNALGKVQHFRLRGQGDSSPGTAECLDRGS
jgi:acyl-coenzyme A synthetase/AMP-(fatty) acid ligase